MHNIQQYTMPMQSAAQPSGYKVHKETQECTILPAVGSAHANTHTQTQVHTDILGWLNIPKNRHESQQP